MTCLYIEGRVIEVPVERAEKSVKDGEWYECTSTGHKIPEQYQNIDVRVFHRNTQKGRAA